jgi:hypothetical protein
MDTTVSAVLAVLMRWIHILSMAVLLGGSMFSRLAFARALEGAAPADRGRLSDRAVAAYRGLVLAAMAGLIGSGIYNFMARRVYPPGYHMWFGIKMLLALHIFAVAFLVASRPMPPDKRMRLTTGVLISGVTVLLISAILRYLGQNS